MPLSESLKTICRCLPGGYAVAAQPDHPLLLEGPEVVAGGEGHLVAVFIPRHHERNRLDRLIARLVVSRLALPSHCRCILALESRDDLSSEDAGWITGHFHGVSVINDQRSLRSVLADKLVGQSNQEISPKFRRLILHRSAVLADLPDRFNVVERHASQAVVAELRQKGFVDVVQAPYDLSGRSRNSRKPIPNLVRRSNVLVGEDQRHAGPALRKALTDHMVEMVNQNYVVDSGVPYLAQHIAGVFVTRKTPSYAPDPGKPKRALAFAGTLLLDSPDISDLEVAVERLDKWLGRTIV